MQIIIKETGKIFDILVEYNEDLFETEREIIIKNNKGDKITMSASEFFENNISKIKIIY